MTPVPATASLPEERIEAPDPRSLSRTLKDRFCVTRIPGDDKAYADGLLHQLQSDRLIWAMAPRQNGGSGFSLKDTARLTFDIATLSGSAGLIYAMHASQALSVVRHGGASSFFHDFLDRMAGGQMLIASGTSEKGVGGDIFHSLCRLEAADDGFFALKKESPNISYLDHAGAVLITAMQGDQAGRESQVLVAAETSQMTLEPGRGSGFLGMKGILNRSYRIGARFPREAIFAEPYPVIARQTMTPSIHILWAALWSGMAYHALKKAKTFIAKEAHGDAAMAANARSELSRLADKHFIMNRLIANAADLFDHGAGSGGEAMGLSSTASIKRLKIVASELLEEIMLGALALMGMRAYAEDGPYSLAEPLRDALSARIMISNMRLRTANAEIERFVDDRL